MRSWVFQNLPFIAAILDIDTTDIQSIFNLYLTNWYGVLYLMKSLTKVMVNPKCFNYIFIPREKENIKVQMLQKLPWPKRTMIKSAQINVHFKNCI